MGSPCVPLISTQTFSGGKFFISPGWMTQAVGNFDVAEIFGDLGGVVHGAADEGDFASVLAGEFDGELDAVDRRREARDEQAALGVGEDFVKLAADGALAGRVSLALDVGGILKQRQHALLCRIRRRCAGRRVCCRWAWDRP